MCLREKYTWKYRFKINGLMTQGRIAEKFIEFESPYYPSTKEDEIYTEGTLTITTGDLHNSPKEIVKNGLEAILALNNRNNFPIEIYILESPPGLLPMMTAN
jgi:hypothetical protein